MERMYPKEFLEELSAGPQESVVIIGIKRIQLDSHKEAPKLPLNVSRRRSLSLMPPMPKVHGRLPNLPQPTAVPKPIGRKDPTMKHAQKPAESFKIVR